MDGSGSTARPRAMTLQNDALINGDLLHRKTFDGSGASGLTRGRLLN